MTFMFSKKPGVQYRFESLLFDFIRDGRPCGSPDETVYDCSKEESAMGMT